MNRLKEKVRKLKQEIKVLYIASKDPRIGILPKIIIAVTLAYALSPIDLIPDFIPVLGFLDDFIILPLFILLVIKLVPKVVMDDARSKVDEDMLLSKNYIGACFIVFIWSILIYWIVRRFA